MDYKNWRLRIIHGSRKNDNIRKRHDPTAILNPPQPTATEKDRRNDRTADFARESP
jgi:hypothetical protein